MSRKMCLPYSAESTLRSKTIVIAFALCVFAFTVLLALPLQAYAAGLSDAQISPIQTRYKSGKAFEPRPRVVVDGKTLTLHVDYELSYTDNLHVGTATVTVRGIGDYLGQQTFTTFDIVGEGGLAVWSRVEGGDRYETMGAIADTAFPSSADKAIVVSGESFPDALSAASLAGSYGCPVILTAHDSLSPQARTQLTRLGVSDVVIVGGTSAVSAAVERSIGGLGIDTSRSMGASRTETSTEVLDRLCSEQPGSEQSDTVIIASGDSYADALSVGPYAYSTASPIILTSRGELSRGEIQAIKRSSNITRVVIVGGDNAVRSASVKAALGSNYTYIRLAGGDRFRTSSAIALWELGQGMTMDRPVVASGTNFPDALAGSALCGSANSVMMLVSDTDRSCFIDVFAPREATVDAGYVLGGSSAISENCFIKLLGMAWNSGIIDNGVPDTLARVNEKLQGASYVWPGDAGRHIVVAPSKGIDWANDAAPAHRWHSIDTKATYNSVFQPWPGDTDGKEPTAGTTVNQAYNRYNSSSTLDRNLYPVMSFSQWRDRYLTIDRYYELSDFEARNCIKQLGGWDDAHTPVITSTHIDIADYGRPLTPSSGYPSVTLADFTEPPVRGAMMMEYLGRKDGYVRYEHVYTDELIVSYNVYGGCGSWAGPCEAHWATPVPYS